MGTLLVKFVHHLTNGMDGLVVDIWQQRDWQCPALISLWVFAYPTMNGTFWQAISVHLTLKLIAAAGGHIYCCCFEQFCNLNLWETGENEFVLAWMAYNSV